MMTLCGICIFSLCRIPVTGLVFSISQKIRDCHLHPGSVSLNGSPSICQQCEWQHIQSAALLSFDISWDGADSARMWMEAHPLHLLMVTAFPYVEVLGLGNVVENQNQY